LSGPVGANLVGGIRAVQAWATWVNERGGVSCHRVEYIVRDDGGDPSRHQAMVRELVEEQHVIAFVQMPAVLSGQASVDYITKHRVPVIGTETGSYWVYESPMYFPQAPSADHTIGVAFAGVATVARGEAKQRVGILTCVESAICTRWRDLAPSYAERFGLKLVYNAQMSITQPDFTSQCQAAKDAGADFLGLAGDTNSLQRLARSCDRVGYHPHFATAGAGALAELADNPLMNGLVVGMNVVPWTVDLPAVRTYREALAKYAPSVPLDASSITGWVSAKLFEEVTRQLPAEPTSKDILEGLWALKGTDLDGLTQPLTFRREQTAPSVFCYWNLVIDGGRYLSRDGGKRTCP
jgi:branched-chain amino acid transport system substrate-binding protein